MSNTPTQSPYFRTLLWGIIVCLCGFIAWTWAQDNIFKSKTAQHYYKTGQRYFDEKNYGKAEEFLQKSLTMDPHHYKAMIEMGNVYIMQGEYIYARQWFFKALDNVGQDRDNREVALFNVGKTFLNEREAPNAWNYLRQAYVMRKVLGEESWPKEKNYILNYVTRDDREGFDKSLVDYWPSEISSWDKKVRTGSWWKPQAILRETNEYIKRNPGSIHTPFIKTWQVWAYSRLRDYATARALIVQLEPAFLEKNKKKDLAWLRHMSYESYLYQDQYVKALAVLNQIQDDYPEYASRQWFKSEKAQVYRKLGDFRSEKESYEAIVSLGESNRLIYKAKQRLFEILLVERDYVRAYAVLISMYKGSTILQVILGIGIGLWLGIFALFMLSRIFFIKNLERIRQSRLKLFDLWLLLLLGSFLEYLIPLVILKFNVQSQNIFGSLSIDPYLFAEIVTNLLIVMIWLCWWRWRYQQSLATMGFKQNGIRVDFSYPILGALAIIFLSSGWDYVLDKWLKLSEMPTHFMEAYFEDITRIGNGSQQGLLILFLALAIPLCEEILFRGVLYNFIRTYSNVWVGVILTSLCFAFSHNSEWLIPIYFIIGVILNIVYIRTKSLIPCIVTHGIVNVVGLWLSGVF